jgi:hypothetical protein
LAGDLETSARLDHLQDHVDTITAGIAHQSTMLSAILKFHRGDWHDQCGGLCFVRSERVSVSPSAKETHRNLTILG